MILPTPAHMNLATLKTRIEDGTIKVPQFQREFVWEIKKSAELIDSILKGYPVGTFIFWCTKEKLRSLKEIGGFTLPKTKTNNSVSYILDGQQRITSIFSCLMGKKINENDYSKIYINLTANDDEQIVVLDVKNLKENNYISFKDLNGGMDLLDLVSKYKSKKILSRITELQHRLAEYLFSTIEINDASIDIATDIFTRINVTGKALSVFEIMCAKIYDEKKGFDLYEKFETIKEEWKDSDYETLSNSTILQAVSICLNSSRSCKNKDIFAIKKDDFIANWDAVIKSINASIDHFKNHYGIAVSKLLPYDALIVPFTYFFFNNNNKKPTEKQDLYLRDYFWRCVFNQRFTEGVTGKLQQDVINVIDTILSNSQPVYTEGVNISTQFLEQKGEFSTGSAIAKGILCLLSSKTPLSFKDGSKVVISNDWLLQSNSKNYHHFFPKKYMQNVQKRTEKVNHIANITILDAETNQDIRAKAPSIYIQNYKNNSNFINIIESHLIDSNLISNGILSDDYDTFFKERLKKYNEELKKLILIKKDFDIY